MDTIALRAISDGSLAGFADGTVLVGVGDRGYFYIGLCMGEVRHACQMSVLATNSQYHNLCTR